MIASVEHIGTRPGTRDSSRGLTALSHAIEYLSEQYVETDGTSSDQKALLQAVHLLMGLHRAVYERSTQSAAEPERLPFWARLIAG